MSFSSSDLTQGAAFVWDQMMHPLLPGSHSISDQELSSMEKGVSHQSRNVVIFTFCIPWWLWFSPSRMHTFLCQAVAVQGLLSGDGTHPTERGLRNSWIWHQKLLEVTDLRVRSWQMVLWGTSRWLRRSYVRNSWISEEGRALCWGCFSVWDSARPTVRGNCISLPTKGWDHLEMVSTIPKFKFNIYRS